MDLLQSTCHALSFFWLKFPCFVIFWLKFPCFYHYLHQRGLICYESLLRFFFPTFIIIMNSRSAMRYYNIVAAAVVFTVWSGSVGVAEGRGSTCKNALSSCGNIGNISYPFQLKGHPTPCGYKKRGLVELECGSNNRTTLYVGNMKYYVQDIRISTRFDEIELWLVDASVLDSNDSCFIPHMSRSPQTYEFSDCGWDGYNYAYASGHFIALLNCSKPIMSSNYTPVDTSACNYSTSASSPGSAGTRYFYALNASSDSHEGLLLDLDEHSCVVQATIPFPTQRYVGATEFPIPVPTSANANATQVPLSDIHLWLSYGFQASLLYGYGEDCSGAVTFKMRWDDFWRNADLGLALKNAGRVFIRIIELKYWLNASAYDKWEVPVFGTITGWFVLRPLIGMSCLFAILLLKWLKRHSSADDEIEEFLRSQNNLMPIKYSYSEIKNMTQGFKFKLGQGGFGSVYKGKLRSGDFVAVKVLLSKSKANGQDFINEVATIGRIHHVNIVRLVGFCVEGSKQALVYDFMPNGSLDKLLFSKQESNTRPVTCLKMHEIALGVARGIEYLHQGCEMQILHFDIKPHNILLDENFVAKVSDFGLAKLYSTDESIVSLTAVGWRGTLGYMAPELFYKNIGGVSYKADVYSFGMLLMEMARRRKNSSPLPEQASQTYFPAWMYDHFDQREELMELEDSSEEEKTMLKKMILVAFWCIQMNPRDRPSMSRALEMLEGEIELVEMPPKPSMCSGDNNAAVKVPAGTSCNPIDTISILWDGR